MNEKRAKALRRACRNAAVPAEPVYLIHQRTGVIRLGKCRKGLYRLLKRHIKKGIPLTPKSTGEAPHAVSGR